MGSQVSELACVYASLILQDEGLEISATNINKLVKAAEVSVEPIWPTLFAKNMTSDSIEALLTNVGSGAAVASVGAEVGVRPLVVTREQLQPRRRRKRRKRSRKRNLTMTWDLDCSINNNHTNKRCCY